MLVGKNESACDSLIPQNIIKGILYGLKDAISGIFAIKNHYRNKEISSSSESTSTSSSTSSTPSSSTSSSLTKQNVKTKPRRNKSSKNTFHMICQCCLLNGCIFWFSLILFDYVLLPFLYAFIHLIFGSQPGVVQTLWYWMRPILSHTFDALWRLPVFLLTRVVNALWFQDIADSTYKGKPFFKSIPKLIADTFFSLMIQALFLVQSLIIAFIPFPLLGHLASLFHLSLLYSLYSFEYKWSNMGWELHRRLQVIENNWPYFLGFGFPLAILTSLSDSWFVSGCIFSLLFPLFIISGNEAKSRRGPCDYPIKIFQPVVWFSNKIFQGTIHLTASSQGKAIFNRYQAMNTKSQ